MDLTQFEGHTPGPWAHVEIMAFAAGFTVEDAECRTVARIMKTHGAVPLPSRINAHLIAAAPYLLAEVRRLTAEAADLRRERDEAAEATKRWRSLALQVDLHRMQALWNLNALIVSPGHADAAREFLAAPPTPGAEIAAKLDALRRERDELAARLAEIERQAPAEHLYAGACGDRPRPEDHGDMLGR